MSILKNYTKKIVIVIGSIVDIVGFVILINNFKKIGMEFIKSGLFWFIVFIIVISLIGLFYILFKELILRIEKLERKSKFIAALIISNKNLGLLNNPDLDAIKLAGLSRQDFLSDGYSEEFIDLIGL